MSIFSEYILKLLNEYKRVLKRYVSPSQREKTIIELGLKRKMLKFDSDVILYNKANRVLHDIENWTKNSINTATEYSGIDEFYQHIKNYLSEYRIEGNQIIHTSQKVSRALVQAIQLISLSHMKLSNQTTQKLEECVQTINHFGSKDQRILFAKAIIQQKNNYRDFGLVQLDNFMKSHEDFL
jgi:hypothetical protein